MRLRHGFSRPLQRVTLGSILGSIASQAAAAASAATSTKPAPVSVIIDEGAVSIPVASTSSLANQIAIATQAVSPTATQTAATQVTTENEAAIATMHTNASLAGNSYPYLAPGVTDVGGVGAPPSYIALPQYVKLPTSQNVGSFPYPTPAPHWTGMCKWWTGQTLLNVGAPNYANDPVDYLRSALVDTGTGQFTAWVVWFLAELGKPATTVYNSAQPWAQALANLDLAQYKFIMTSEGPVYLPFNYADLVALEAAVSQYQYAYDAATLAAYNAQWVAGVLPDVSQFPLSTRLDPNTSGESQYYSNHLPAIFRQGTTLLAQIAPYLPVLSIALGAGLLTVLAIGSGVGAQAASAATDVGTDVGTDALTTGADDALTAGADISLTTAGGDLLPELPEEIVSDTAVGAASGATTGLTIAAAGGAALPMLDEETVTATPLASTPPPITTDLSLTSTAASDLANAASNLPNPNYPTQSAPPSELEKLASGLAKLLTGGSSAPVVGTAGETGVTGSTGGGDLGDWLAGLTGTDWLLILAAGATGLYFVHESRPKRKARA